MKSYKQTTEEDRMKGWRNIDQGDKRSGKNTGNREEKSQNIKYTRKVL